METQYTKDAAVLENEMTSGEFAPGTPVVYALHGRCNVMGIETRELGGQAMRFYKLEIQKSALSRSSRQEPAIWVPIENARERGLRAPINTGTLEAVNQIFSSREYYFELNQPWNAVLPKLESTIRQEGAIGLAKVASFLHVLKKKQVVASSEVNRFQETVHKILFREISELTGETMKALEEKALKAFRQKLLPDS